jgi:hypothetical protein
VVRLVVVVGRLVCSGEGVDAAGLRGYMAAIGVAGGLVGDPVSGRGTRFPICPTFHQHDTARHDTQPTTRHERTLYDGQAVGLVAVLLDKDSPDPLLHLRLAIGAQQVLGLARMPQPEERDLHSEQQTQESGGSVARVQQTRSAIDVGLTVVMVVTDPFVAPLEELFHELGVIDQLHDVAVEQHNATWSGVLPTWRGKSKGPRHKC